MFLSFIVWVHHEKKEDERSLTALLFLQKKYESLFFLPCSFVSNFSSLSIAGGQQHNSNSNGFPTEFFTLLSIIAEIYKVQNSWMDVFYGSGIVQSSVRLRRKRRRGPTN